MKTKIAFTFLILTSILFVYSCADEGTPESKEENSIEVINDENQEETPNEDAIESEIELNTEENSSTDNKPKNDNIETNSSKVEAEEQEALKESPPEEKNPVDDAPKEVKKVHTWKEGPIIYDQNTGKAVGQDTKGDLLNDAAEEIALSKEEECGGKDCGKVVYLENFNSDKSIKALVEFNWKENDTKEKLKRSYIVKPKEKLDIGCSAVCKNGNKIAVKWKIIGAQYAH